MTFITKTTAETYLGQPIYIDARNNGSFTAEAMDHEFGRFFATHAEALAEAEYYIFNQVRCGGMDGIS